MSFTAMLAIPAVLLLAGLVLGLVNAVRYRSGKYLLLSLVCLGGLLAGFGLLVEFITRM